MAEPQEIVELVSEQLFNNLPLSGKQVMITAGPIFEPTSWNTLEIILPEKWAFLLR